MVIGLSYSYFVMLPQRLLSPLKYVWLHGLIPSVGHPFAYILKLETRSVGRILLYILGGTIDEGFLGH